MAGSVRARFEERGLLRLEGVLEQLQKDSSDLEESGAWQAVSTVLSDEFETLFEKEGGHRGPRWSRLSPVTVKMRAEKNQTPIRIGWATGRMATSLIEPTHPDAFEVRTPMDFFRGTSANREGVSYPSIFERGKENQPPRPIVGRLFRRGNKRTTTRLAEAVEKRVFRSVKKDGPPRDR